MSRVLNPNKVVLRRPTLRKNPIQYKIAILGQYSTGKTCIAIRYRDHVFDPEAPCTICVEYLECPGKAFGTPISFLIWDTAGQEQYALVVNSLMRNLDGAMIVYALDSADSFSAAQMWVKKVRDYNGADLPMLLVGNKYDLIDDSGGGHASSALSSIPSGGSLSHLINGTTFTPAATTIYAPTPSSSPADTAARGNYLPYSTRSRPTSPRLSVASSSTARDARWAQDSAGTVERRAAAEAEVAASDTESVNDECGDDAGNGYDGPDLRPTLAHLAGESATMRSCSSVGSDSSVGGGGGGGSSGRGSRGASGASSAAASPPTPASPRSSRGPSVSRTPSRSVRDFGTPDRIYASASDARYEEGDLHAPSFQTLANERRGVPDQSHAPSWMRKRLPRATPARVVLDYVRGAGLEHIETSALSNHNVDASFGMLAELIVRHKYGASSAAEAAALISSGVGVAVESSAHAGAEAPAPPRELAWRATGEFSDIALNGSDTRLAQRSAAAAANGHVALDGAGSSDTGKTTERRCCVVS